MFLYRAFSCDVMLSSASIATEINIHLNSSIFIHYCIIVLLYCNIVQGWHCKRLWEHQRIGRDGEGSWKPQHCITRHLTEERECVNYGFSVNFSIRGSSARWSRTRMVRSIIITLRDSTGKKMWWKEQQYTLNALKIWLFVYFHIFKHLMILVKCNFVRV